MRFELKCKAHIMACWGTLILVLIMAAFLPLPAFASLPPPPPSEISPSQILESVPVTLTNVQQAAAPNPFQQMVVIDSSEYSQYEAPNLQNVVWYYPNGTIIPAWIESGASSASNATVWWLRLRGFPAHSSLTVYMGFAAPNYSFLSASGPTGEAPQLSPTYGQYDDGNLVFNFYDNFAGTSLNPNKWVVVASGLNYTVDNGLRYTAAGSRANALCIVSAQSFTAPYAVDFLGSASNTAIDAGVFFGVQSMNASAISMMWNQRGAVNTSAYPGYGSYDWLQVNNGPQAGKVAATGLPSFTDTNEHLFSLIVGPGGNSVETQRDGKTLIDDASFPYDNYTSGHIGPRVGLSGWDNVAWPGAEFWQWIRVRAYPPNGVMPNYVIWPAGPGAFAYSTIIPILNGLSYGYCLFWANFTPIIIIVIVFALFSPALTPSRVGASLRRNWEAPLLIEFAGLLTAAVVSYSLGKSSLADLFSVGAYFALVAALVVVVLEAWRRERRRIEPSGGIKEGAH